MAKSYKKHTSNLNGPLKARIERILSRLKNSVNIYQVNSWLENFEANEVNMALDFLLFLEYITFPELQYRIEEKLKLILKAVPKENTIIFLAFGDYPKSSDIVMYLLAKLESFKTKERKLVLSKDIHREIITEKTNIVYIDDFLGSGKSFHKWFTKNKIVNFLGANHLVEDKQFLLTALSMVDGKNFLSLHYPEIQLYAELRNKLFSPRTSPFIVSHSRIGMRALCIKYGSTLKVGFIKPATEVFMPLGYERSESLIAFDYGSPNNTISIIWGDSKWHPIFPRQTKSRIEKAKEIKTKIEFYIAIMNNLGISENENYEIVVGKTKEFYSGQSDYAAITVTFLKMKNMDDAMICQHLCVTEAEFLSIQKECRKRKLLSVTNKLTKRAKALINQIEKKSVKFKFRENSDLNPHKDNIFIPKTFNGKT